MSKMPQPYTLTESIHRAAQRWLAKHDAEVLREAAHSGLFGATAQSTLLELARQKEEEND